MAHRVRFRTPISIVTICLLFVFFWHKACKLLFGLRLATFWKEP